MSSKVIVITGPESSGKTTLANQLSGYWKTPLDPEIIGDYLREKNSYQQQDLFEIAKDEQARFFHLPDRKFATQVYSLLWPGAKLSMGTVTP